MPKSLRSYTCDPRGCAFLPSARVRASNQRGEKLRIETTAFGAELIVYTWWLVMPQKFRLKPVCDQTLVDVLPLHLKSDWKRNICVERDQRRVIKPLRQRMETI